MRIIIKSKNLDLTPSLNAYIEKRIMSLKKFINILGQEEPQDGKTLAEVFVEIEKETRHHKKGHVFKAQAEILLPGRKIMAQAHGEDLGKAVTEVRDELKHEIAKYKFKGKEERRKEIRKMKENIEESE